MGPLIALGFIHLHPIKSTDLFPGLTCLNGCLNFGKFWNGSKRILKFLYKYAFPGIEKERLKVNYL